MPRYDKLVIAEVIRDFAWHSYGMEDTAIAINDDPDGQEWVDALAEKIYEALR